MRNDILRTNTAIEGLKSLEKLDETLALVNDDVYQWKWAIIVMHNCVQAFLVLALQGTASFDVARNRSKYNEYIDSVMSDEIIKYENVKLDYFLSLYKKIKTSDDTQLYCCKTKFDSTVEHDAAMHALNDFRNQLIHFFPCGWSLFIDGWPKIVALVMEIVEFLINDIGNFMYRFSEDEKDKMKKHIRSIDKKLEELEYEEK